MGLLGRLKGARKSVASIPASSWHASATNVPAHLIGGNEDLEIVGEASYQDALWAICGGSNGDRIRHKIIAVRA